MSGNPEMIQRVALLPYDKRPVLGLSRISLSELHWPLKPLAIHNGTIADLGPDDHIIVQPNSHTLYLPHPGVKCRISTWIREPRSIHGKHFLLLRLFGHRFHRIFTYNSDFIGQMPNARFCMSGWPWIKNPENLQIHKTAMTSLIASKKRDLEGHKLRHQIADWVLANKVDVELLGSAYKSFGPKEDGLAPYRFSVVIENSSEQGYISEKLLDSLLCKTIPIYWGAPDIGKHFDTGGMIICSNFEDCIHAISKLTMDDYEQRLPAIERNHQLALTHADLSLNIAKSLLNEES